MRTHFRALLGSRTLLYIQNLGALHCPNLEGPLPTYSWEASISAPLQDPKSPVLLLILSKGDKAYVGIQLLHSTLGASRPTTITSP